MEFKELKIQIINLLRKSPQPMTQKQIAHDLNETNDGNVYKALDELQDEKKIKKESEGFENYYSLI